jgi:exodeoxyribonuclease V alpha subunit
MKSRHEAQLSDAPPETIEGLVDIVTFHSDDTGFTVLKIRARGTRGQTALTGKTPAVHVGEWVRATGRWVIDRQHGRQFQADAIQTLLPDSREGLEKFLGSGLIRGIGPVYAKKLLDRFGLGVMDVIENRSAELEKVEGIGPQRRRQIKESWTASKNIREIMAFLMANGVSAARAFRIHKAYGDNAIATVRLDPYCLARDIRGIGFQSADRIAIRLGIPPDSPLRARAGLSYALDELAAQGHCACPRDELLRKARDLLSIDLPVLERALEAEIAEQRLVSTPGEDGADWIYLANLFHAERETAERLASLLRGRHPCPGVDADVAADWVQTKLSMTLAPGQRAAFAAAFRQKLLVVTGGPGVGKTTLVRAWVRALAAKKLRILLAAPTGRAAKRMAELSGMEARTIHRLLGYEPSTGGFRHNARTPLEADVLVVDETSMIDIPLAQALLRAVPPSALLLFVGDMDQLPSVGPGCFLRDMIESGTLPVVRLTQVFRQGAGSLIVENAHRINHGEMPVLPPPNAPSAPGAPAPDFHFIPAEDPSRALDVIRRLATDLVPRRCRLSPADIQILSPMQKGELGTRNLNLLLQTALNPPSPRTPEIERFGWRWRVGDRVMQTENDYDKDVFNGDLGTIQSVSPDENLLTVRYDDRNVPYDFRELDELSPAYAVTIHKSQGSEYPCVVVPLHTQHYVMLQRNLLYTAVTRGKKQVFLVGSPRALGIAVRNADSTRRHTALRARLRRLLPPFPPIA